MAQSSTDYVNLLDINLNYSQEENLLALKIHFVLSFCELIMGNKTRLETIEKTIIDRAVQLIYQLYFSDLRLKSMPILSYLMNALLSQHTSKVENILENSDFIYMLNQALTIGRYWWNG